MRRVGPLGFILIAVLALTVVSIAIVQWPKAAVAETRAKAAAPSKPAAPPASTPAAPLVAPPGTVLHQVAKGESMHTLFRKYWADSSYMTTAEFGGAVRELNAGKIKGDWPKPGETLIIPGMEGPITEKSIPEPKDFEVRAIYLTGIMAGSHNGLELIKRW